MDPRNSDIAASESSENKRVSSSSTVDRENRQTQSQDATSSVDNDVMMTEASSRLENQMSSLHNQASYHHSPMSGTKSTTCSPGFTPFQCNVHDAIGDLSNGGPQAQLPPEMGQLLVKLQEMVPNTPRDKTLSKLEIMQYVIDYINDLQGALESQ